MNNDQAGISKRTTRSKKMTPINYGLFLLGRRDYSIGELRRKLREHYRTEINEIKVEEVIDRFLELGYLDDQRFADSFVRRESQRQQGPMKVRSLLLQKKVSPSLVDAALAEINWFDVCLQLLEIKAAKFKDADKAKIYRFLAARGFSNEHIQDSLNRIYMEPEYE